MYKLVRLATVTLLVAVAIGAQPQQGAQVKPYKIVLENFKVNNVGLWRIRRVGESKATVSLRKPENVVGPGSSKGRKYNVTFGSAKFYRASGKELSLRQGMGLIKPGTVFLSIIGKQNPATGQISATTAKLR